MLNMNSVADVFSRNFPKIFRTAILKENLPTGALHFINKEHLWMSASDEVTLKKDYSASKASSNVTLKTK